MYFGGVNVQTGIQNDRDEIGRGKIPRHERSPNSPLLLHAFSTLGLPVLFQVSEHK